MRDFDTFQNIITRLLAGAPVRWDLAKLTFLVMYAHEAPYLEESHKILTHLKNTLDALIKLSGQANTAAIFAFLKLLATKCSRFEKMLTTLNLDQEEEDDFFGEVLQADIPSLLYVIWSACSDPKKSEQLLDRAVALEYPDALAQKGRHALENGEIQRAEALFEQAMASYQNRTSVGIALHTLATQLSYHFLTKENNRLKTEKLCDAAIAYFDEMRNTKTTGENIPYLVYCENQSNEEHSVALWMRIVLDLDVLEPIQMRDRINQAEALYPAFSAYFLGLLYEDGWLSDAPDYGKASYYFDKALKLGYDEALFNRARLYLLGLDGNRNIPKGIALMERAFRETKSGDVTSPALEHYHALEDKDRETLLDLIWLELLAGLAFSNHAIGLLQKWAKPLLLQKIQHSAFGSSLMFLKYLKSSPSHPINRIFSGDSQNRSANELKRLFEPVHHLAMERRIFDTQASRQVCYLKDIAKHIIEALQPGYALDTELIAKVMYHVNTLKIKLESVLEHSLSESPWPMGYLGLGYELRFKNRVFIVPREIFELYTLLKAKKPCEQKIKALTQESIHPDRLSFFHKITGTAPSRQTLAFFEEVEEEMIKLDDKMTDMLLAFKG